MSSVCACACSIERVNLDLRNLLWPNTELMLMVGLDRAKVYNYTKCMYVRLPNNNKLLYTAYAGILCEFLEVAIHFILYIREIYPAGIASTLYVYIVQW